MKKHSKFLKFFVFLVFFVAIASVTFFVNGFFALASSEWRGPTADPPGNNISGLIEIRNPGDNNPQAASIDISGKLKVRDIVEVDNLLLDGNGSIMVSNGTICLGSQNPSDCKGSWDEIGGGESLWRLSDNNQIYYNSGNVGVGIDNPSQEFEVLGNIKSSEDIYLSNSKALRVDGAGITNLNIGNWGNQGSGVILNMHNGGILAMGSDSSGWSGGNLGAGIRMMWIPRKGAFRAGNVDNNQWDSSNIGNSSFAGGWNTIASGSTSFAMGSLTKALGYSSTALGYGTEASGQYSTALGYQTKAMGHGSTAIGSGTASGALSVSIGTGIASADSSIAMGRRIIVSGGSSFGIGLDNVPRTLSQPNTMAIVGGNVGIDMVNPSQKLEVSGSIKSSEDIYLSSGKAIRVDGAGVTNLNIGNWVGSGVNLNIDGGVLAMGSHGSGWDGENLGGGSRMMWVPAKSAFRVGYAQGDQWNSLNIGEYSFASGFSSKALGKYSFAAGNSAEAIGDLSFSSGWITKAEGISSIAMGANSEAVGDYSVSIGLNSRAYGHNSFAIGRDTRSTGNYSIVAGQQTVASGNYSIAAGRESTASSDYSLAVGFKTEAFGSGSTAMGFLAKSSGDGSTAMGLKTEASGGGSIAFGLETKASGDGSTAMGRNTVASGSGSTAMGDLTKASAGSFAAGSQSEASGLGSTAMGSQTKASGDFSIAVGDRTIASGNWSTAIGILSTASGNNSTAIGALTEASGLGSTAMGDRTTASGNNSTALGYQTKALNLGSFAAGIETEASGIGSTAIGSGTEALGNYSVALGYQTKALNLGSFAAGIGTTASGNNSTAMGYSSESFGNFSTAIGTLVKASGAISTAMGRAITVSGSRSFGIGLDDQSRTLSQPNTMAIVGGKVGIGKVDPETELDVKGTVKTESLCLGSDCRSEWPGDGGTSLWKKNGNNIYYPADNKGMVGIGIDNPTSKLHIKGSGWEDSRIMVQSTSQDWPAALNLILLGNHSDPVIGFSQRKRFIFGKDRIDNNPLRSFEGFITNEDASRINIYQNLMQEQCYRNNPEGHTCPDLYWAIAMTITPDRKIGIGELNPTERLDVKGNIKSSGQIKGNWMHMNSGSINDISTIDHNLRVDGNIQLGKTNSKPNCDSGNEGKIVYENGKFYGCTQSGWRQLHAD